MVGSVILGFTMVAAIIFYSVMENTDSTSIIILGAVLLVFMIINLIYGFKKIK